MMDNERPHGYAIAGAIRDNSGEKLNIEFGSLYPALKRLEIEAFDRIACAAEIEDSVTYRFTSHCTGQPHSAHP